MCLNKLRDLPDYRRSSHFSILAVGASFQMFWILIYILVFSSCTLDPLTEKLLDVLPNLRFSIIYYFCHPVCLHW